MKKEGSRQKLVAHRDKGRELMGQLGNRRIKEEVICPREWGTKAWKPMLRFFILRGVPMAE